MDKIIFQRIVVHPSLNNIPKIGLVLHSQYPHLYPKNRFFLPITLPDSVPKYDREKKLNQKMYLVKFLIKMVITYLFSKIDQNSLKSV